MARIVKRRLRGLYQEDIYPPRLQISVKVSEVLYAGIAAIAAAEGWTISRAASEILADYFHGERS